MTEQTVYTELIVLKFQDQAQAGMAQATASFERSANEIKSSLARIGPVAAEVGQLAGGQFGLSWKAAFALWKAGVDAEKAYLKDRARLTREMNAEAVTEAKAKAAGLMAMAKYERLQEEANAKAKLAEEKATTAEELEIAKALHQYRLEGAREELEIDRALNRYRMEGEAEVLAVQRAAALEQRVIDRELHTYRKETIAAEVEQTEIAAATELEIAKALHRYRMEAMREEAAAKKEQAAFMGMPQGGARLTGGMGTSAAIGAAVVGFEAFEGAKKYNDALREMGTLLNDAGTSNFTFNANLRETGELARDFSSRFNIDVVDVLKSFKEALSSGFDQGDLARVGEIGAEMSRAMHVSMEESVDVLSTVRNAWHMSVDDMQVAGDRLFNMVNYGRIRMEEIRTSFGRVSSAAAAAGLSFQDVSAALIVLTKDGQTNSQAVTALAAAINRVDTASDSLKHKFELAGISASDLDFHTHTLVSVMEKLAEVTHGNAEILHDLFPEAREYRGVVDLITHINELKEAERGAAETGTLLVAANRNLDNGFDRLGGTAKAAWNGITASISTALDKYYEWGDAIRTGGRGREAEADMQQFGKSQLARYGDLFASSGSVHGGDGGWSGLAKMGAKLATGNSAGALGDINDRTAQMGIEERRDKLGKGTMSMGDIAKMQEDFSRRLAMEEGFAEKVKAMDDARLKSQRAIATAAKDEAKAKKDIALNDMEMSAAAKEREATAKASEKMAKKHGMAKAFAGLGGSLHDGADDWLASFGMPDVQQVEDAIKHMREAGKKILKEGVEQHKLAVSARDHLMKQAAHKREQDEKKAADFELDVRRELGAEMVSIYEKDARDFAKFQEQKEKDAEKVNKKMLKDLEALGGVETSLHERMFQHGMQHAEHGGKDPARAARFAQERVESEESKIKTAIAGGQLSEKEFSRMIGEFRKFGDARSSALSRNKDGDRADREDRDRDSVEEGMVAAFRKMLGDNAHHDIAAINGRTFVGKSRNEVAKEALQKVEAKHVDQVVNQNITVTTQGVTADYIKKQIDEGITKALSDIKARGTGISGRPTTSRGGPVGRAGFSGDDSNDDD